MGGKRLLELAENDLSNARDNLARARYDHIADGFRRTWKVVDVEEFARIVGNQLCEEDEVGNTPVTKLLDEACFLAVEDTTAVVEDGRLDPPDDWTHLEGSIR